MIGLFSMVAVGHAQSPEQLAADALPLPLYLDARQIQSALAGADWQGCVDASPTVGEVTATLMLQIDGDGQTEPVWSGAGALGACWSEVARSVSFPAHDEVPLRARWTVAVRGGKVYPYPVATLQQREDSPLSVFVAPDATAAQRAALLEALGVRAAPQAPAEQ
ncbi:MAG: hypothetical protein ACI8S6_005746 [Myxococcota bacterium]